MGDGRVHAAAICAAALFLIALPIAPFARAGEASLTVGVKQNMTAALYTPEGPGPYPGILLLHTSGGLRDADTAYAKQLAGQNYVVLVPAFMAAYGITGRTRQLTFTSSAEPIYADFVAALDLLSHQLKLDDEQRAALGKVMEERRGDLLKFVDATPPPTVQMRLAPPPSFHWGPE